MKKNKFFQFAFLFPGALLLAGCLGGSLRTDASALENQDWGVRFYIQKIHFSDNGTHDMLDEYFFQFQVMELNRMMAKFYPGVFNSSAEKNSIPLTLSITQKAEDLGVGFYCAVLPQTLWFFASLGILPIYYPTMEFKYDIDIDFNSRWGKKIFSEKSPFQLNLNYWFGACPWFFGLYDHGKIYMEGSERVLEFGGTVFDLKRLFSNFVQHSVMNTVVRAVRANRRNLMHRILLAEVENRWAVLAGVETVKAIYASDDPRIWKKRLEKAEWKTGRIKLFSGKKVLKNDLEGALENYLGNAGKNDLILFFWSGEIYNDPARPWDVYLVCADTVAGEVWSGYKLSDIFASLKENRSSKAVIVLDVCRKSGRKTLLSADYIKGLNPLSEWLIIANESAARSDQISSGVLTEMVFKGENGAADADKDGVVSLGELCRYLMREKKPGNSLIVIPPTKRSKLLDYSISNK